MKINKLFIIGVFLLVIPLVMSDTNISLDNIEECEIEEVNGTYFICGHSEDYFMANVTHDDEIRAEQIFEEETVKSFEVSTTSSTSKKRFFISCYDSDGGKEYFKKGNLTVKYFFRGEIKTWVFEDKCGGNLLEGYCRGKLPAVKTQKCEFGCNDGMCMEEPSLCGNGVVDSGEECDGSVDIFCIDLPYEAGDLSCNSECSYDETECVEKLFRSYSFESQEEAPFGENISVLMDWNEFSFTILPENKSLVNVLDSIDGWYSEIKTFEDGELLFWNEEFPDFANTLQEINYGQEYRINIKHPGLIVIYGYPDPEHPYLINTTWSDWINISCLSNNTMNQSRSLVQYDYNGIDEDNHTFTEYIAEESCVYDSGPVIDLVSVNDADPTIGSVTSVIITVQITDLNGIDDISNVGIEFVIGNPSNGNLIESNMRSECDDIDSDTIECIASYDMWHYDNPGEYNVEVNVSDLSGLNDSEEDSFMYNTLVALELDVSDVGFGSLDLGEDKEILGDLDWNSGSATVKNQGNVLIDADVRADNFTSLEDSFESEQIMLRFGILDYFSLSNDYITETNLNLDYGISSVTNVDFKINVPIDQAFGIYDSEFEIIAVID